MLISGVEVNRDNLRSWSPEALRKMQEELVKNIDKNIGDAKEQKLLIKLMTVEIKRKNKIHNINVSASKEVDRIVKNWESLVNQNFQVKEGKK